MKTTKNQLIVSSMFVFFSLSTFAATLEVIPSFNSPTCKNKKDGSISLFIAGGKAPYSILWSDGSTATQREGLSCGKYHYTVTDSKGIELIGDVALDPVKPISVSFGMKNMSEINGTKAVGDFLVQGGNPIDGFGYIVKLDGQMITEQNPVSEPGHHELEIQDASGCSMKFPVLSITEKRARYCEENYDEDLKFQGLPVIVILIPDLKLQPVNSSITAQTNL